MGKTRQCINTWGETHRGWKIATQEALRGVVEPDEIGQEERWEGEGKIEQR